MEMYTWAQVATAAKPTPQTCARERHTNHGDKTCARERHEPWRSVSWEQEPWLATAPKPTPQTCASGRVMKERRFE